MGDRPDYNSKRGFQSFKDALNSEFTKESVRGGLDITGVSSFIDLLGLIPDSRPGRGAARLENWMGPRPTPKPGSPVELEPADTGSFAIGPLGRIRGLPHPNSRNLRMRNRSRMTEEEAVSRLHYPQEWAESNDRKLNPHLWGDENISPTDSQREDSWFRRGEREPEMAWHNPTDTHNANLKHIERELIRRKLAKQTSHDYPRRGPFSGIDDETVQSLGTSVSRETSDSPYYGADLGDLIRWTREPKK